MNVAIEAGVLEGNARMTTVLVSVITSTFWSVVHLFDLISARPIARILRSVGNTLNAPNTNLDWGRAAGVRA